MTTLGLRRKQLPSSSKSQPPNVDPRQGVPRRRTKRLLSAARSTPCRLSSSTRETPYLLGKVPAVVIKKWPPSSLKVAAVVIKSGRRRR